MPFQKIEKHSGRGRFGARISGVRASLFVRGKSAIRQVYISIAADVQAATGLAAGDRFDALLGNGDESGFLGIQKTESLSARKLSRLGRQLVIRISHNSLGTAAKFEATDLPYRIDGDMLVIDIRPLLPAAEQAKAA